MKKNKILFILVFVICLMFGINSVEAKTVCKYKQSDTGNIIELIVRPGWIEVEINDELKDVDVNFTIEEGDGCPNKIYTVKSTGAIYKDNSHNSYTELSLVDTTSNKVSCGNITGIPKKIPELTSLAVTVVQIAIPIILVIMGSIDLFKGITAGKEDEMKKGQQMFIKRLIVGALIFFIVAIVKLLISVVAQSSTNDIVSCIDCFVDNDCD